MTRAAPDPSLQKYLSVIGRIPILDRATELALARRWRRSGDRAAAHALVEGNLRFVARFAARYLGYGLPLDDLVAEGNLGLLAALRRFEPERKLRFITYAGYWIDAYLLEYVQQQWSLVRLGRGALWSTLFFRLRRARARLEGALGGEERSINARLARRFGTTEGVLREIAARLDRHDTSLDVNAFRDSTVTRLEILEDQRPGPEEMAGDAERDAQVRNAVASLWPSLDARSRMIGERVLLSPTGGETMASVARSLGLSRERVRQINETVKSRLREALTPFALDDERGA